MMTGLLWVLGWVFGITAIIIALDQLMLWMERKGLIYWRRSKRVGGSSISNAFLEVQSMIEPDKKNIVEIIREEKKDQTNSGALPDPTNSGKKKIFEQE